MTRSPENSCVAARCVYDDPLRSRRREHMRITSKSCNSIQNLRVNRRGDDQEGPVAQ